VKIIQRSLTTAVAGLALLVVIGIVVLGRPDRD